jgi:hypothetical protein
MVFDLVYNWTLVENVVAKEGVSINECMYNQFFKQNFAKLYL